MFAVIYAFDVKKGKEAQFLENWKLLTQCIYEYEGSLGSRLHKGAGQTYVAYANWPSQETWESFGESLPSKAKEYSRLMNNACNLIKIDHTLQTLEDLLKKQPFK